MDKPPAWKLYGAAILASLYSIHTFSWFSLFLGCSLVGYCIDRGHRGVLWVFGWAMFMALFTGVLIACKAAYEFSQAWDHAMSVNDAVKSAQEEQHQDKVN